jgi:hypothetical protein
MLSGFSEAAPDNQSLVAKEFTGSTSCWCSYSNSVCLTNSVLLVTFGKHEGGIHGCAGCPAGIYHRR